MDLGFAIVDLVILVIILIAIIIGIFKNPIFGAINLTLFIVFTYVFNAIVAAILPGVVSSLNLEDIFIGAANNIVSLNEKLISLGNEMGLSLSLLPSYLEDATYYETLLNTGINISSFIIAAILSLIVSYGLTWLIYGLLKKFSPKFKEFVSNIYNKKLLRIPLGIVSSLSVAVYFVAFSFTPLNKISKGVEVPINTLLNLKIDGYFDEEFNKAEQLILEVEDIDTTLDGYKNSINSLNSDLNDYQAVIDGFYSRYLLIKNEINLLNQDVEDLLNVNLTSSERAVLNEARSYISQAQKDFSEIESTYDEYSGIVNDYRMDIDSYLNDINKAQEEINGYLVTFNESQAALDDLTTNLDSLQTTLINTQDILDSTIDSSWFSFLLNIDFYPYFDFNYNNEKSDFFNELDKFDNSLQEFADDNLSNIKAYLIDTLNEAENSLDEGKGEIEKYDDEINEVLNEVDDKKSEIDKIILDTDNLIDEANENVLKAKEEIKVLKDKYGV